MFGEKFIAVKAYIKKKESSQVHNPPFLSTKLEKENYSTHKANRRKEIIIITVERSNKKEKNNREYKEN